MIAGESLNQVPGLQQLYTELGFRPVWTIDDGHRINGLVKDIKASYHQGLDPKDYHLEVIERLLAADDDSTESSIGLEMLASGAWLTLASDYATGRVRSRVIDNQWHQARKTYDPVESLVAAIADNLPTGFLERLLPQQPGYHRLVELLAVLRSQPDWPNVRIQGKPEIGTRTPGIQSLKRRLQASGDLAEDASTDELFDESTAQALKIFQLRHGLKPDMIPGPATLAALNVSRQQRIRQMMVNLERWRWLPEQLGRRHIRVNIADFRVEAWEDGHSVLTMKAIVGRTYRRTPVFSSNMSYLVFNPYWEIPRNIAVQDKLPLFRKDPDAVKRGGYEIYASSEKLESETIEWDKVNSGNFPYRLRQRPGSQNALGRVKLLFPNPYNVYLHDTPDRHLFERENRTFSSGCIRVQKPLELAAWVLAEQPEWSLKRVEASIATGKTKTVMVRPVIPVHVEYWTAWVDVDGKVNYRADVYGRDALVDKAL
jgi:murein L,D-transpeptidase YcbB/YkuD